MLPTLQSNSTVWGKPIPSNFDYSNTPRCHLGHDVPFFFLCMFFLQVLLFDALWGQEQATTICKSILIMSHSFIIIIIIIILAFGFLCSLDLQCLCCHPKSSLFLYGLATLFSFGSMSGALKRMEIRMTFKYDSRIARPRAPIAPFACINILAFHLYFTVFSIAWLVPLFFLVCLFVCFFFFFFCFFFCFWKQLAIDCVVVFILAMMLSQASIGTHLCNKTQLAFVFATKLYRHPSLLWSHTNIHLCYKVTLAPSLLQSHTCKGFCNKAILAFVFAMNSYWHLSLEWNYIGTRLKRMNHRLFQGIFWIPPPITQPL